MSVNYYAVGPGLDGDNPDDPGLHIGQYVHHMEFLWRGHVERGLVSAAAWRELLTQPGVTIVAEHGAHIPFNDFWAVVIVRPTDAAQAGRDVRPRIGHHFESLPSASAYWRDLAGGGHAFYGGEFC